jgi:uncharacterized protein
VAYGKRLTASKVFHVSPFCSVDGHYEFCFLRTGDRIVARVEHHNNDGPLLITSVSGRLVPLTREAARRAVLRMPLMTLAVVARIHWQAARLWVKRVPWHAKPQPPSSLVSR